MIKQIFAAGVVIGAVFTSVPAHAANCANRDLVVERLQSKYDESFAAGGLQSSRTKQGLVEVWASHKTGTFTVMLTTPEGMTCVLATGTDWHQIDPKDNETGTPS